MSDASDEAGFLADICANPADDTTRLVFADWLDEHGEPDRAEFIRVQVALAKDEVELNRLRAADEPHIDVQRRVILARLRERELLFASPAEGEANGTNWLPGPLFDILNGAGRLIFPDGDSFAWSRGFVDRVTCTAADWLAHADQIAWHPGQTVECGKCVPDAKAASRLDPVRERRRPDGSVERYMELEPFTFKSAKPPRSLCPTCSGTGRVARPCPPTAQPITRVTLTTRPTLAHHIQMFRTRFGPDNVPDTEGEVVDTDAEQIELLRGWWPGITFAIPHTPAPEPQPPTLNQHTA
jgi:uncharacterized protein (TIGR02996 family)